ncbi:MAG: hypothetical protein J0G30_05820 [Actinomycetales bacterium]|nr:hypothetical protein [Actinomycetales bacterium]
MAQAPGDRSNRLVILGTKALAEKLIARLVDAGLPPVAVITWDDAADTRSRLPELAELSSAIGADFTVARRGAEAHTALEAAEPTVVFVAGWYRLIPDDVLAVAPRGFVGAHYSPLPHYRGSAPVVWQLLRGEERIGFSIFRLGSEMDEGALAGTGWVPAGDGYVGDVLERLDDAAIDSWVSVAPGLLAGTHRFEAQPDERPSYTSIRIPADGRIDWSAPAESIVRAVRAQSRPYPGAWSELGPKPVTVWRAAVENSADYFGVPGQVIRVLGPHAVVACGDGGVLLEEHTGPVLTLGSRLS